MISRTLVIQNQAKHKKTNMCKTIEQTQKNIRLDDWRGGLVLFWSLKNPTYPERVIRTRQGVAWQQNL